jgi:hypothetical protein
LIYYKKETNLEFALGARRRQAKHISRNNEAHLNKNSCSGKAVSITHFESVLVALVIQRAKRMPCILPIVICGLSGFTICFHIVSQKM